MPASGKDPVIVFFDLDGTLVDESNLVPPSAAAAVRQLRANGHLAFINTGRSRAGIHPHILSVGFDGIIASCGTYIEYHGETLLSQLIQADVLAEILPRLEQNRIDAFLEGPEHVYFPQLPPDGQAAWYYQMFAELPGVNRDWHAGPVDASKLCLILASEAEREPVIQLLGSSFSLISHAPDLFCEAVQSGFSKATGMQFVLDRLGFSREQTLAFGDSANDLEMLAFARLGIAMGSSLGQVLAASDHVTGTAAENGISDALHHFGLI